MREVKALMGWYTEVTIRVSDEESAEHIKGRLAVAAMHKLHHMFLYEMPVFGENTPEVIDCPTDEDLVDQ